MNRRDGFVEDPFDVLGLVFCRGWTRWRACSGNMARCEEYEENGEMSAGVTILLHKLRAGSVVESSLKSKADVGLYLASVVRKELLFGESSDGSGMLKFFHRLL